jgi:hypothetical protein
MLLAKTHNKRIKSDSVNLSSFLQKAAKKSPNSLRSLCGRYALILLQHRAHNKQKELF